MKTTRSINATRGRRQTLNMSLLFLLFWLIDIGIIHPFFAFASDIPWNYSNLQHVVRVNGQFRWTIDIESGKALCTPSCPSYYQYLTSLRCGDIENEVNDAVNKPEISIEKIKEDTEKDEGSSFRPKLWGSVKGAFEMNMEAKDELIHNTANTDETKMICPPESKSSGSSQTFLPSLGDGSAPTTSLRKIAVREDFEDESEIYDSSEEEDENNVNENAISKDYTRDEVKEDLSGDVSSDEETTDEFQEPEGGSEIIEEDENLEDSNIIHEDMSYEEQVVDLSFVGEETIEEAAYIDSFLNELSEEEEVPQSFEDIVREEWSMIPDTEGEDEGDENDIEELKQKIAQQDAIKAREEEKRQKREARRAKRKEEKRQKRAERRAKEAKERLKVKERETLQRDQILTDPPNEIHQQEQLDDPKQPENVVSEIETKTPAAIETPPQNRESVYVSSGLVSNIIICLRFVACTRQDLILLSFL